MIQDRDPGDETDARETGDVIGFAHDGVAILRPATKPDHFTTDEARDTLLRILGGVGLPSQRILQRTLERQAREQSDHRQMAGPDH